MSGRRARRHSAAFIGPQPVAPATDFGARAGRVSRDALIDRTGADDAFITELQRNGLLAVGPAGYYEDAVRLVEAAAALVSYGIETRHLRAFKVSADREAGLVAQIAGPIAKGRGTGARDRAEELVREIAALSVTLPNVKAGLRGALDWRPGARYGVASMAHLIREVRKMGGCGWSASGGAAEQPAGAAVARTRRRRYLAILVGGVKRPLSLYAAEGYRAARPLTHDLMVNLISAFERKLIGKCASSTCKRALYAEMVFDGNVRVSARPSDSIAVALRSDVPIIADETYSPGPVC